MNKITGTNYISPVSWKEKTDVFEYVQPNLI
jgi:hypothetical protein